MNKKIQISIVVYLIQATSFTECTQHKRGAHIIHADVSFDHNIPCIQDNLQGQKNRNDCKSIIKNKFSMCVRHDCYSVNDFLQKENNGAE